MNNYRIRFEKTINGKSERWGKEHTRTTQAADLRSAAFQLLRETRRRYGHFLWIKILQAARQGENGKWLDYGEAICAPINFDLAASVESGWKVNP